MVFRVIGNTNIILKIFRVSTQKRLNVRNGFDSKQKARWPRYLLLLLLRLVLVAVGQCGQFFQLAPLSSLALDVRLQVLSDGAAGCAVRRTAARRLRVEVHVEVQVREVFVHVEGVEFIHRQKFEGRHSLHLARSTA